MYTQKQKGGSRHPHGRGRHRKKAVNVYQKKKLYIAAGAAILLILLIYIAGSIFFRNHFFINTEINGHGFSGKTVADAKNYFTEQVKEYSLTVQETDNQTEQIKGSDITLSYRPDKQLANVLHMQNALLWPKAFQDRKSASAAIDLTYDKKALDKAIGSLKAVSKKSTLPVSAHPQFDGNQFVVQPEVYGTAVDKDILKKNIITAIRELTPKLDLEKKGCYAKPKYTAKSPEVQKACDEMNNYLKASITYPMNQPEVVDKTLISSWLSVSDDMKVIFDENAVRDWLKKFGEKYDTVGTQRTFTTPAGKNATVSGGTYGWSINEDTEFKNLINSIKKQEVVTREPACYIGGTAAAHAMPDWGNTFVDVDLTMQHMWYVKDGSVLLETDVVTGEPIPEKVTPEGVFSLQDKKTNEVLVGSINPSTGEPAYRSKVSYWMRITWDTGIGLHDANWQTSFGGSRNQIPTVGSHGCVNMPPDQAAALYNVIEIGTPVIIHY